MTSKRPLHTAELLTHLPNEADGPVAGRGRGGGGEREIYDTSQPNSGSMGRSLLEEKGGVWLVAAGRGGWEGRLIF